jgi:hypothetical protein
MYTVTIRGLIVGWRFGQSGLSWRCWNNLVNIIQWGCLRLGNKGAYFKGCEKVKCTARDALDLKETTDLQSMFEGASSFTGDLSAWHWAGYQYESHVSWRILLHKRFIRVADWAGYRYK